MVVTAKKPKKLQVLIHVTFTHISHRRSLHSDQFRGHLKLVSPIQCPTMYEILKSPPSMSDWMEHYDVKVRSTFDPPDMNFNHFIVLSCWIFV